MFMIMPCRVFPIGGTGRKLLPNSWKIGLFPPSPTLPLLFCPWIVDFAIFMQLLFILAKRPHFGNIWFLIIAWRRGQVVQYNNETSFYLFTFLIQCLRKSFKNIVCIRTEVFCSIKILQISWKMVFKFILNVATNYFYIF